MDKNTVTGLLLMGALLMGFMYCNRQGQEEAAKQQQEQAEREAAARVAAKETATPAIDTRLAADIAATVRRTGTMTDTVAHRYQLTAGTAMLTAGDSTDLAGTVKLGDQAIDVAAVFNPADTTLTQAQRNAAVSEIRTQLASIEQYGDLSKFLGGDEKTVTLKSDNINVTFSSLGGRVSQVVLNKYNTEYNPASKDGKATRKAPTPIRLFDASTNTYSFEFQTATQRINTADLNFNIEQLNDTTVLMSLPIKNGAVLGLRYTLVPEKYLVRMDIVQKDVDKAIPGIKNTAALNWHQTMLRNEVGRTFEQNKSELTYKFAGESPDYLNFSGEDAEDLKGNIRWVAFKNQFFSSVLIAKNKLNTANIKSIALNDDPVALKDMDMKATFDYKASADEPAQFTFYFGPNLYPLLSSLDDAMPGYGDTPDESTDLELRKLVPLGWGIFGWINRFVVIPVFTFLGKFIHSYGIIILLLTLFIKLILFPLTYKSYKSQAKMRVLAPEIKEINEKYPGKEEALKRQQETMKLYSKAGASPFSGCLPMLLQMPVLIAMFAFFPSAIELRGQSFLWAHDLSAPDYIFTLPFSIPFLGNHLSLFCLLMTAVNIIYTRINMQSQPTQSTVPAMKWMMYLMPVMFLFFFNDYASGLSYYYFLSLLITIIQTYSFRWFMDEKKMRAEMMENAKKPKKKSGFMARLEAAQKKQEALMREQAKQNARRRR